jgi:hypothetical protein
MARQRDWTGTEIDTVLDNPTMSDADLAALMPGRRADEVASIREQIHAYHQGGDLKMLSDLIVKATGEKQGGKTVCAICDAVF